jgi:hypothetical protein
VQTGGDDPYPAQGVPQLSIWAEAETRAEVVDMHQRIRALFHDVTNYTLGASPHTTFCTISRRISQPAIGRADDDKKAPWEGQAFYEFQVNEDSAF